MNEKQKRQHSLSNRQLARAFNFSADDLAANRAGFMSKAQEWGIPLWMRILFAWLGDLMPGGSRRRVVSAVCGRAKLEYKQFQISSLFHADIVEVHILDINAMEFRLKPQQYQMISAGIHYRVYYDPETKKVLSLERAMKGCSDE